LLFLESIRPRCYFWDSRFGDVISDNPIASLSTAICELIKTLGENV